MLPWPAGTMANTLADSITPFFSIWIEPRATIRRIVDSDPTRNVIAIAAIGPGLGALVSQWSSVINGTTNPSVLWPVWVVLSVAIQGAFGILFLYILGAVFRWSGGLLGGTASRVEMRTAVAWSQVPAIAIYIVLLLSMFAGVPIPQMLPGRFPRIDPAFDKVLVVIGVLGVWGFIVHLKCFGEVHRFSAWRAFAAILIPPFLVLLVFLIGFYLFVSIGRHH
jgi:Yip1-like protein